MNYFATPISSDASFENYQKTVIKGVEQSELKPFEYLTGTTDILFNRFQSKGNRLHLWGIKKDKFTRWSKVKSDDILFFYRRQSIVSWCKILDKFEDSDIATILWGAFESIHYSRYTWPLILILDNPNSCNIPFVKFNKILGYEEHYSLRSFFMLNDRFNQYVESKYSNIEEFVLGESTSK